MALAGIRATRLVIRAIRRLTGGHEADPAVVRRQWDELQAELIVLDEYRTRDPHDPQAA